jgi:hypothetical protein
VERSFSLPTARRYAALLALLLAAGYVTDGWQTLSLGRGDFSLRRRCPARHFGHIRAA